MVHGAGSGMRGVWLIKDMWCRKWVNVMHGLGCSSILSSDLIWQAKTTVSLSCIQLTLLRYSEQLYRSLLVRDHYSLVAMLYDLNLKLSILPMAGPV